VNTEEIKRLQRWRADVSIPKREGSPQPKQIKVNVEGSQKGGQGRCAAAGGQR